MATLHLMIGLPCSGKTTYARRLAKGNGALVLTPDLWQLRLFGDDVADEAHDVRHSAIEAIMWEMAEHVLKVGGDVILDFGFWARVERDDFRGRAKALGVGFQLHYMDVLEEELYRRLAVRNQSKSGEVLVIPKEEMDKYIAIFQPPAEDELT